MSNTSGDYYRAAQFHERQARESRLEITYLQIVLDTLDEEKDGMTPQEIKSTQRRIRRRMARYRRSARKAEKRASKYMQQFGKINAREKREWAPFSTSRDSDPSQ